MAETAEAERKANLPLQQLAGSIKHLWTSKVLTDCTIKQQDSGQEWKVHRFLLLVHSDALRATLERGAQLEQTAEKNTVVLDDAAEIIESMLCYMYNLDYSPPEGADISSAAIHHVNMFIVADKYLIEPLRSLALSKFEDTLHGCPGDYSLTEVIRAVYNTEADREDQLKDVVLQAVRDSPVEWRTLRKFECPGCQNTFDMIEPMPYYFDCPGSGNACAVRVGEDWEDDERGKYNWKVGKGKVLRRYKCPTGGNMFEMLEPLPDNFDCPDGTCTCKSMTKGLWEQHEIVAAIRN